MKKFILVMAIATTGILQSCKTLHIKETIHLGRPHFEIQTKTATYLLDKAGGALSAVKDRDGIDWVQYNGDPRASAPAGAAGGFRGIPNLVYRSADGGAGHPGFDQCNSERASRRSIRSRSISGNWQWIWTFFDNYAQLTIEKTDLRHAYWFLYEGPVGGNFNPMQKYWGTNLGGPRYEVPSLNAGESIIGRWRWAYFGDREINRIFLVAHLQEDSLADHFAYMGNTADGNQAKEGMIVFGFGRAKGARPLMTRAGNSFLIAFIEATATADHNQIRKQVEKMLIRKN